MEFELQYELDEFKLIQDQYFDKDNKCYTGVNLSTDIMEKMLNLIDNLSERVNVLEPVIKQQIKKSLPIHDVSNSLINELKRRQTFIQTEPNGQVRETMIDNLLIDL